ncbi:putative cysteine-rich receptor-like protein kinase 31 [Eutrema salsugineum]|uniref:putative cysteine-rich receptor-like protein kinase 31 n=1 Tax=Eutrema salsugineum TaxID=72664 RepID=UPI000CECEC89|nr:putative cysteine-rich receptor-like protein kinase 31 [Eutrema salsugineum]
MCVNNLLSILCFFLAISFGYVSAEVCEDSLFFIPNDTYDTNRRLVLSTLASNVISQDGFYNVSVGEGPGKIYALGLCIPGAEPKVCSDCIQASSEYLLERCPNQTDSFDWSPQKTLCLVRYSNNSFFNEIDLEPYQAGYYGGDIPGNVTEFNRVWEVLMTRMIVAASSLTPGSHSGRHYAADMIPFTGFINIYALMQCIPGISSKDCEKCLLENVRTQQGCCSRTKGGIVRRPVCFSQTNISPFFGAFYNITLSPPPQHVQAPQTSPPPVDLHSSTKEDGKKISTRTVVVIGVLAAAAVIMLLLALGFGFFRRRKSYKPMNYKSEFCCDGITPSHPLQYDLSTIEAATDNFSDKNKLGEGGFGVVYKGTFPNGTEIAVKRLSIASTQGFQEFKNEVIVVAKLQHYNLVRLLGFCLEGEEKILIYEFLSNKSLDLFLFDTMTKRQLDWTKRYNIIEGIARGILYLHRDSRPKVIHRDLKASNVLLDAEMKPKIADFGLAKILAVEQTRAETCRIAGTYGYMAPEYMNLGQFSMESDVYSFGVLVLEIVSGKTCGSFYRIDDTDCNLVTYAWRIWRKGSVDEEFVDRTFGKDYQIEQVRRCIHIALLCVQADHTNRPKMCKINSMLASSKISLPEPHEPGFLLPGRC